MSWNILLYGATGYSGNLIAEEMRYWAERDPGVFNLILGGREGERLKAMANRYGADYRVFGLDERRDARRALTDVDVVLNAAGPFAWTAQRLAKVAMELGCHYVDINGEADVYNKLDDLHLEAMQHGVALVSGAGFWSAASDWLLEDGLKHFPADEPLETVRIAMSRIQTFSRGSAETVWRSLRQQVVVLRKTEENGAERLVPWHEPVGKLERTFDFTAPGDKERDLRIASAASLVDTLSARLTLERYKCMPRSVESYIETDLGRRIAYQAGALMSAFAATRASRALVRQTLSWLSEGPSPAERGRERHLVILQLEDRYRRNLVDWRWETPNVYEFTAQLAVGVAAGVGIQVGGRKLAGWCSPAEALIRLRQDAAARVLRGCNAIEDRSAR
ncbi:MAG TPA: saccharopine dehydrogenase NADP-binding domain-containing protein [Burkholderiales bacterium]|nr:saccharopine dehydrogenase NADP-binding domain-containing protein [Burkholderiales bacterium]